jgi:hypothetical protein
MTIVGFVIAMFKPDDPALKSQERVAAEELVTGMTDDEVIREYEIAKGQVARVVNTPKFFGGVLFRDGQCFCYSSRT